MPLDPQAKALLDLQTLTGFRGFDQMPVAEARAAFLARAADAPTEPVAAVEDRTTPDGVPVRLYWPNGTEAETLIPALVYSHGGGWVAGHPDTCDATCRALANASGCLIASVDYRLAPEHKFPAALEDAANAFGWVVAEAEALGADPTRIAVGGDSAGGNLAIGTALLARDQGGPRPAFQLLIYPVTNYQFNTRSYQECAEGYGLTRAAMEYYWSQYLSKPEDGANPHASPLRADLTGLPPAWVLTAECDPLRDEGEAVARRLREFGVPATLRRFEGQIHGFFHLGHIIAQGRAAIAEAAEALHQALMPAHSGTVS